MADDKNLEDKAKDIHVSFLSDEEKEKIQRQVQRELDEENKKKISDDYKASLKSAAKKKALFKDAKQGTDENGLVPVFIDLSSVSECIRIDGTAFYPGRMYNVLPAVKDLLLEVMHRGWEHEDSLNGKTAKENLFRKQNKNPINV